jgi:hypothetical protein
LVYNERNTTMSQVEQELLTLPKHPSPPRFSVGFIHAARSLVFCVIFCRSSSSWGEGAIVLSDLLWFTASDCPFGIFKLFLMFESKYWWLMPVVAGLISRFQQDFVQTILLNIIYFPWALFFCLPCFRVYIRFKLFLISTLGDDKIKHVKVCLHD